MVRLYTHKRFLGGRHVIYEPVKFFKTTVAEAIRQGLYELSDEQKAIIAGEADVMKLEGDVVITKYGEMSIEDISWRAKMLITMVYMHDMCHDEVINISHNGRHLKELLDQAERYGIDLFMNFQYCSESWKDISTTVRFNGRNDEQRLGDIVMGLNFGFGSCPDMEPETHLQFGGANAKYDLWIPSSHITLICDNSFQRRKFINDLQKAVQNGSIRATGTLRNGYRDVEISPQQILIATEENIDYVRQKLEDGKSNYVVVYEHAGGINSALGCLETCMGPIVNKIVLCTKDENSYLVQTYLEEKTVPACGDEKTRLEFTVREAADVIIRREELTFETLDAED